MCNTCLQHPCHPRCPQYSPPKTNIYCCICGDGIYEGNEYIKNIDGEYAHWECFDTPSALLDFLDYKIEIMENIEGEKYE